ncbi:MAG: L-seryl-tRNA(Sec) selenium transferase [Candidatus Sericytochromatia bacterium]
MNKNLVLKKIYSVNKVIEYFSALYPDDYKIYSNFIKELIKLELNTLRSALEKKISISETLELPTIDKFVFKIKNKLTEELKGNLKPLINATGIILHTNFGRSIFSKKTSEDLNLFLTNYSNLEYDLDKAKRGSRQDLIKDLIIHLTGAEDCLVLNNNAACIFLICNTFANKKEAIISRGEMIEIGDSFRLHEIIKASGVKLLEVGSTNKTNKKDYFDNITSKTKLLIKSYPSNYKIIGFSKSISSEELAQIGLKKNILTYEDIGSGLLIPPKQINLEDEPYILDKLRSNIDLISFSTDKLLGGPQAGIILGKKIYLDKIKKNPLARAVRIDKVNLFLLEKTLIEYLKNTDEIIKEIPILKMINKTYDEVYLECKYFKDKVKNDNFILEIREYFSIVGGGSLPDYKIKTPVIALKHKKISLAKIQKILRELDKPIITNFDNESLIFNLRTINDKNNIDFIISILNKGF